MLVNNIISTAEENGARKVVSVEVEIGEFSFLNFDQVEFCYHILTSDTILEGSKIKLSMKKGVVQCESCKYMGPIATVKDSEEYGMEIMSFMCPECSRMTRIIEGQEFIIQRIEMEVE